jgi:hypothetical protein
VRRSGPCLEQLGRHLHTHPGHIFEASPLALAHHLRTYLGRNLEARPLAHHLRTYLGRNLEARPLAHHLRTYLGRNLEARPLASVLCPLLIPTRTTHRALETDLEPHCFQDLGTDLFSGQTADTVHVDPQGPSQLGPDDAHLPSDPCHRALGLNNRACPTGKAGVNGQGSACGQNKPRGPRSAEFLVVRWGWDPRQPHYPTDLGAMEPR